MFKYSEYALLHELIGDISHELSYFPARTVGMVVYIKENKDKFDKKVRKIAKKYDKRVGKFLKDIQGPFQKAVEIDLDLGVGFQSLEAADYAFTMAVLDFAGEVVPGMVENAAKIRPGKVVSEEDIDFYKTFARFMKSYTDEVRQGMSDVEQPRFLDHLQASNETIPPFIVGVAHAGLTSWLSKTASSLTTTITGTGKAMMGEAAGCVTSPWRCTKTAFKRTQQGIGMAVDSVNLAVGSTMDVAAGIAAGNKWSDTSDIIAKNIMKTYKAWDEGKAGAAVLKNAQGYIEAVDKGVGAFAKGVVNKTYDVADAAVRTATGGYIKKVWGRDTASWAAGKLGEMTSNMATGGAQGLLKLANTGSSTTDLVEGAIDVAFAFTGGSKSAVTGAQALQGTAKVSKELAKKGTSQVARLSLKLESKALKASTNKILAEAQKKLSKGQIKNIYKNTAMIVSNEAAEKILKNTEKKMGKIIMESMEQGGKAMWGNLKKEVPEAFSNFCQKSFTNNMAGYKEAAKSIFGGSLKEWGNNLVGGQVDTWIKGFAKMLVPAGDKKKIDSQIEGGDALAGLDASDPTVAKMMASMAEVAKETSGQLAMAQKEAQAAAAAATEAVVEQKLLEEVEKETAKVEKEILSKPVTGHGAFTGSYGGELRLTLVPGGGAVSGKVGNEYGGGTVNGKVREDGSIVAYVNGSMSWDDYDHVNDKDIKINCTLSAKMTGRVGDGSASGSYRGTCGPKTQKGGWSVTW
jgi:hypothetical protein